jgi:multidrug efflux pump subunit AcrA (membrane-fusion protein)
MNQSQRNKNLIKNIALAFLTMMLLLTFFSNTIMNHSLPEVATASVNSGNVTTKIRGSGTVEAAQDYNVKLQKARKISSVKVKVGDNVKAGQVIVLLADATDDDALQAARDKLDEASLAYAEALCDRVPDYTLDELGIAQDQQAVNQAAAGSYKGTAAECIYQG